MIRILKNPLREHIKTIFRGRTFLFKSKEAKVFNFDNEEEREAYAHWKHIYSFLRDITTNIIKGGENK